MRPRWRKVFTDLFSHKVRSLLVIASIAIGLFAVGMIMTIRSVLSDDMREGYRAINAANIQVRAERFDLDFAERIRNLPGVADAQGVWAMELRVRTGPDEWSPITIKAIPDLEDIRINQVRHVSGNWPPAEGEIVLDFNRLPETGYAVGDELEIKLPSGTIRRMRLVGSIQDQTIGSASGGGGFFLAPYQGYITYDTLDALEQPEALNILYVTVEDGNENRQHISEVAQVIMQEFDKNGYTAFNSVVRRSSDHPNVTYLDAMGAVLIVLGFLVVFLSGFLITNTLAALLNQQVQQIGVMKTLGGTRAQIGGIYTVLILVFSAIALAISIPLAQQAAFGLLEYLSGRINFNLQGQRLVPSAYLIQAGLAVVVPLIAGSIPIIQGTRISVQEALNGTGSSRVDDGGRIFALLARIRGITRPLMISLRNTFRRRVRLALTLLTLTLGGAIFMATFNVRASIEDYIERLGRYYVADVNLTLSRLYRVEEVQRDLLAVTGIAAVEGWAGARAEVIHPDGTPGESVQLVAPPADSNLIEPILLEGRWIAPGDQNAIALSEMFQDEVPEARVGQTIRLKVNGEETEWLVVGLFQFAGRSSGLFAYASFDYLSELTHSPGRSSFFRIVAADRLDTVEEQDELSRRVETHLTGLGYKMSEVRPGLSLQEATSSGLNILIIFLLIMSLLMASVGSIGLMGTMSLNVMERTREIGVMRAIGGSDRAIINLVIVEGMLIGLISWLLAWVFSFLISKVLADAIFLVIFNNTARLTFTLTGSVIWFGLVMLLSVLASVLPAYNASRLTIREVLAYE